jgi:hypothetical protein
MSIMAEMLLIENQNECDTDFRIPMMNNFARRIGKDCTAIRQHIEKSGKIGVVGRDEDFVLEYSSEIWRVVDMLAGLDVSVIREFADNLRLEFNQQLEEKA